MLKDKVTPMMAQYLTIKEQNPGCILFFRLGDFYEMFFEDATTCARELEITLTGKDCGLEERAPMCGVPFHAADNYISRLVEKGYKVAICEQVEDPKTAKGLVKRDIIRIVTPGTILEGGNVKEGKNNYIASITLKANYGFSICDITTGEWLCTTIDNKKKLLDELAKFEPTEVLVSENVYKDEEVIDFLKDRFHSLVEVINPANLDSAITKDTLLTHFNIKVLESIGLSADNVDTLAAASLLIYLKETQKNELTHLKSIRSYNVDSYMLLDISTRRNLELTETLREKKRKGSLLWVLDQTKTAMGSRYIRKAIEQPLINVDDINARLDATEELVNKPLEKEEIVDLLKKIYDIERIMSKFSFGTCNARDMISLKQSLEVLPAIKDYLKNMQSAGLKNIYEKLNVLEDIYNLINDAIEEEPPISVREGKMIKSSFNSEVARLREIRDKGASWLSEIEVKEREKTGIKNLKIKYNKVFGYFLEVTQSYANLVPDYFIRKQTLANCERYITDELKKIEEELLGADDKLNVLEYQLFTNIRETVVGQMDRLLSTSNQIAKLDMLVSFAAVADNYGYVKPLVSNSYDLEIKEGRHPVVEKILGGNGFIANDISLNDADSQMMLLTGPNMAGKSTYMRQIALIVLMAQIGSFVPAEYAKIGAVDRIFTRVGASDDLASGQSTFMVEMMEVANILHHATKDSLLILDEIGRGTSTLDGLSIAWSIIEHITNKLGAKTLFATHYHELTALEKEISVIKNYCIAVKEHGDDIIFLHKIVPGSVDHSYGIQVAKLAGVPNEVISRAKALLHQLEGKEELNIKVDGVKVTNMPAEAEDDSLKIEISAQDVLNDIAGDMPAINTEKQENAIVKEDDLKETDLKQKNLKQQENPIYKNSTFNQLNLFSISTKEEIIEQIKTIDVLNTSPIKAIEILYEMQRKLTKE